MVSLIFVSNSYKLAEITAKYIKDTVKANIKISFSGGMGNNHKEFGTDAYEILNAVKNAYSDDGVIIFCDFGSALTNSELAVSMLDDEKKNHKMSELLLPHL